MSVPLEVVTCEGWSLPGGGGSRNRQSIVPKAQSFLVMHAVSLSHLQNSSEAPSVSLTFQSLCQFFSSVDPSGLLDLPATLTKVSVTRLILCSMDFSSNEII